MTASIGVVVVAIGLFAVGLWGRRHAAELVPTGIPRADQMIRWRQYRRGAATFQLVAVLAVVAVIVEACRAA